MSVWAMSRFYELWIAVSFDAGSASTSRCVDEILVTSLYVSGGSKKTNPKVKNVLMEAWQTYPKLSEKNRAAGQMEACGS